MRNNSFSGGFFFTISTACCYASLFSIFLDREGFDVSVYPACIIIYLPIIYVLNYLLLKKERSVSFLGAVNGICVSGLLAVSFIFCGFDGFIGIFMRLFACIAVSYYTITLAVNSPALSAYFVALDASVLLIIVSFAVESFGSNVSSTPEIAILGAATALIGLMNTRMGNVFGFKGLCIAAGSLAALGGLAWLFAKKIAGFAGGGIVAAFNGLLAAAAFVLKIIERILIWFLSLFPVSDEAFEPEASGIAIDISGAAEGQPEASGAVLAVLVAGMLILFAVFFFVFRKIKIGGIKTSAGGSGGEKKVSLFEAFKRIFKELSERIAAAWLLAVKRKDPKAVFFRLERAYSRTSLRRRTGETPREFLLRLKAVNPDDPDYCGAFDEIISKTELAFYSGKPGKDVFLSEKRLYKLTAKQKASILKRTES